MASEVAAAAGRGTLPAAHRLCTLRIEAGILTEYVQQTVDRNGQHVLSVDDRRAMKPTASGQSVLRQTERSERRIVAE